MECCFESCVDKGEQWPLPKDKIYCFNCGKVKPHYNNIVSEDNVASTNNPESNNRDSNVKHKVRNSCKCKESCKEWILSFIGLGSKLPDCCKGTPLTAWNSGDVARANLRSKLQEVIHRIRGGDKVLHVKRSSTVTISEDYQENIQKNIPSLISENKTVRGAVEELITTDQVYGKEKEIQGAVKKHKQSAVIPRHKTKRRRNSGSSKSSSEQSDIEARIKLKFQSFDRHISGNFGASSPTASSVDLSGPAKSKTRSQQSSDVFNPFHRRIRACKCSRSDKLKSFFCPQLPCVPCNKSWHRVKPVVLEDGERSQSLYKSTLHPNRNGKPSSKETSLVTKKPSPICNKERPTGVRKSSSMPCHSCFCAPKPIASRFCRCDPQVLCGCPKLPCRSQSFHSTLLRSPSPLAVVLPKKSPCCRPCAVSTSRSGCRKFKCACPLERCSKRSRSSSRSSCCGVTRSPNCHTSMCKDHGRHRSTGSCSDKKSHCGNEQCQYGSKPPLTMCTPCCTKPCCLPCPRKFTVFPYCPRIDVTSKRYMSIPCCTMQRACPCPSGGTCTCPLPRHRNLTLPCCQSTTSPICKTACSTNTQMSYIKAKQNDAICQRLLSKYGFSPPVCHPCPTPCYGGGVSEGLCTPTSSCIKEAFNYSGGSATPTAAGGGAGCKSCMPHG